MPKRQWTDPIPLPVLEGDSGFNFLCWTGDRYLLIGSGSGGKVAMESFDGYNWSRFMPGVSLPDGAIASNNAGTVVMSSSGAASMWRSTDHGHTWASIGFPTGGFQAGWWNQYGLHWTGDQFIGTKRGTAYNNAITYTSPDGLAWTTRTNLPNTGGWMDFEQQGSTLICYPQGNPDAPYIARSVDDGLTWARVNLPTTRNPLMASANGVFLIRGDTAGSMVRSPDGLNWAVQNLAGVDFFAQPRPARDEFFTNDSNNGVTDSWVSPDGLTWEFVQNYMPINSLSSVVDGPGAPAPLAVGTMWDTGAWVVSLGLAAAEPAPPEPFWTLYHGTQETLA